ncbi:MAG: hypothetical protein K0S76_2935 [Herbinix sp.]|jgi:HD-GYP domain-containing protein (c-di-GMP phosphodiesterase class II)|nr:hypothetical protein [Herbinix sp.]
MTENNNILKIRLNECTYGQILAGDVLNDKGHILVGKNTILNQYIIDWLLDKGISMVMIYQPYSGNHESMVRDNYHDMILNTKEVLQELTSGKPLNYKKVFTISKQIYTFINENENIIKCIMDLKKTDEYTHTHSVNTAIYCMLIAKWLMLSEDEINLSIQSGLLHDLGKSKIPTKILNKRGRLTEEEYNIMKQHPVYGYEMVKDNDEIAYDIKMAILHHHERVDGSGYPNQFTADEMNLYAKIVALADVFDAMTSDRIYKKRSTPFEVFDMLLTEGIRLFDTKILNVLLNNLTVYLIGANVLLSDGNKGEIVFIPMHSVTNPIIRVSTDYLDLSKDTGIQILSMI